MLRLSQLNLYLTIRLKTGLITTGFFIVLALVHVKIIQSTDSYSFHFWDYLLISIGGIFIQDSIWKLFGWMSAIVPIMFYLFHLIGVMGGYDLFLFLRSRSRIRWWTAKYIAILLLTTFYAVWYVLVHAFVGLIYFPIDSQWGSYVQLIGLNQNHKPFIMLVIVFLIFVTGLIAFSAIAQLTLMRRKTSTGLILFSIFIYISGIAYLEGLLPREVTPIMYPSFLDLIAQNMTWEELITNTLVCNTTVFFCCFLISCFWNRKYEYL